MTSLTINLFGSPTILQEDQPVKPDTKKAIALLILLLCQNGHEIPREKAAVLLWPDYDTKRSQANLRRALSSLRKTIGSEQVVANRNSIQLTLDNIICDLLQFKEESQTVHTPNPKLGQQLDFLLSLHQKEFLAGFSLRDSLDFDDWLYQERLHLHQALNYAIESGLQALAIQEVETAVPLAQTWVNSDPTHETAHQQLMRLYAQQGRYALARKQYEICVTVLQKELGVAPQPETTQLFEVISQEASSHMTAFVGRQAELNQLNQTLHTLQTGQGVGLLLGGESGVGKSRLLKELELQAKAEGLTVLWGQGIQEASQPYILWQPILHRLCVMSELDDLTASVLLPFVPDLPNILNQEIAPAPELNAKADKLRLFTTITHLLSQHQQQLVLLLEDLQWVSEDLELLKWLSERLEDLSLLLIGTYRSNERPFLSTELPHLHHILLDPLTQEAIQQLCDTALGAHASQTEVIHFLQQQSQGNTFFLVESIHALAEQVHQEQSETLFLPDSISPQDIQSILQRRLAYLPDEVKRLLYLAAIAGKQIDKKLLTYLAKEDQFIEETWLPLMKATILLTVHENHWQFAHDKLREGLLAQLTDTNLRQQHRQVAHAIEAIYPKDASYAVSLMTHWQMAQNPGKERLYAQQAGAYAKTQYAYQDALTYYQRAESLLSETELAELYTILVAQEQLYKYIGEPHNQLRILSQLSYLAPQLNPLAQARILVKQANYAGISGDFEQGFKYVQKAILFEGDSKEANETKANAHCTLGSLFARKGDYQQSYQQYQTGLQLAKQSNLSLPIATCLLGLGNHAFIQKGNLEEAISFYEQSLSIFQTIGDLKGQGDALINLGTMSQNLSQYQLAQQYGEQALSIYRQIGYQSGEATSNNNLGVLASAQGNYKQAQWYNEQALRIYRQLGERADEAKILENMGILAHKQGDFTVAKTFYRQTLAIAREIASPSKEADVLNNLGEILADQAHFEEAKQHYEQALAMRQQRNEELYIGLSLNALGEIALMMGELSVSEHYYQQAKTIHEATKRHYYLVEDWAGLAQVKLTQSNQEEAGQYTQKIVAYLQKNPRLAGATLPMRAFHFAWNVLVQLGETSQANHVLSLALQPIQAYLDKTTSPIARQMYLQQRHHNILWQAWQNKSVSRVDKSLNSPK